jgi:hypothetical protein
MDAATTFGGNFDLTIVEMPDNALVPLPNENIDIPTLLKVGGRLRDPDKHTWRGAISREQWNLETVLLIVNLIFLALPLAYELEAIELAEAASLAARQASEASELATFVARAEALADEEAADTLIELAGLDPPADVTASAVADDVAVSAGTPDQAAVVNTPNVDQVLLRLRDEATELTKKVSTSSAGTQFLPTKFGSVNDSVFKALVKKAVAEGRLPPTIQTSPSSMNVPGSGGIDVWDTATGRGWDLTTARSEQVVGHDLRYLTGISGVTAPDGTVITDVTPLVYSR